MLDFIAAKNVSVMIIMSASAKKENAVARLGCRFVFGAAQSVTLLNMPTKCFARQSVEVKK